MKVLLRKNVDRLGVIGDVVDVKSGYARNHLLPKGLAIQPTEANVKAVEADRQRYLQELARERADMEARAAAIEGKEITIAARANVEGQLYGSVGPAQIVAALADQNIFLQPGNIVLDPPIRRLDKYDVTVRFAEEITTTIHVWIVPIHEEGDEALEGEPPPAEQPGAEELAAPTAEAQQTEDAPAQPPEET